jgi:hypothetical protein
MAILCGQNAMNFIILPSNDMNVQFALKRSVFAPVFYPLCRSLIPGGSWLNNFFYRIVLK